MWKRGKAEHMVHLVTVWHLLRQRIDHAPKRGVCEFHLKYWQSTVLDFEVFFSIFNFLLIFSTIFAKLLQNFLYENHFDNFVKFFKKFGAPGIINEEIKLLVNIVALCSKLHYETRARSILLLLSPFNTFVSKLFP